MKNKFPIIILFLLIMKNLAASGEISSVSDRNYLLFNFVPIHWHFQINYTFAQDLNEPWDISKVEKKNLIDNLENDNSFMKQIFYKIIKFYQKNISPLDGGRCPMYPTCSQYSIEANKKHGPLLGFILTADRLIHEGDEKKFVSEIEIFGNKRFYDPVSNNDFWFYTQYQKEK